MAIPKIQRKSDFSLQKFSSRSEKTHSEEVSVTKEISPFAKILEDKQKKVYHEEIDAAIEDLQKFKQTFLKFPSQKSLMMYKKQIALFFDKIHRKYQHFQFYRGVQRKVELHIWKKVEEQFDILERKFALEHQDGMNALENFQQLEGLLIDLKVQ